MTTTTNDWARNERSSSMQWSEGAAVSASPADVPLTAARRGAIGRRLTALSKDLPAHRPPSEGLQCAALQGLEGRSRRIRLADLWDAAVAGEATAFREWFGETRIYAVARMFDARTGARTPLRSGEAAVLTRVLCGQQQKAVALDLGIAFSTASKYCTDALEKVGLVGRPVPLPFILAAQAAAEGIEVASAICSPFEYEGRSYAALSVPKPRIAGASVLTASERDVVLHLIEGCSREQIAVRRSTSAQTVACQLRAIFAKLALSGRQSAIRRGAELGWFAGP